MNRALGVAAYCLRRQRRKLPVFLLVLLALAGASAAISLAAGQTVSMEYMGGGYKVGPSYAGAAMYANSSSFTNPALYEIYLYVAAIVLIRRERKFIVTMSVSRHEFLAGSYLFLVALSAAMVVAIWLTSLIGYAALWALGYGMGAAITPMQLLTGNWTKLIVAFSWMASGAGIVTLIGYLTARWWKIILSVLGSLIAAAILVATQLNLRTNAAMVLDWLERVVYWIFEVAVPMIYRYFWGAAPAAMVARNLLLGLGATVASYPVMRGMRIVK